MTSLGRLQGNLVVLDDRPTAPDGLRVRVHLVPIEEPEAIVSAEVLADAWRTWAERGPQGPVEDEADFPEP